MDCSLPGFPVHGILQARILEWLAMPSSRGSSQPRDWTHVSGGSCTAGRFLATEPPGKPGDPTTSLKCGNSLGLRKVLCLTSTVSSLRVQIWASQMKTHIWCDGLNCVPLEFLHWSSNPPEPQSGTMFGDRTLEEVVKGKWGLRARWCACQPGSSPQPPSPAFTGVLLCRHGWLNQADLTWFRASML